MNGKRCVATDLSSANVMETPEATYELTITAFFHSVQFFLSDLSSSPCISAEVVAFASTAVDDSSSSYPSASEGETFGLAARIARVRVFREM